jgi:uncharacterized membrane protein YkoI
MKAVQSLRVAVMALMLVAGAGGARAQEAPGSASQVIARETSAQRKVSMEQAVRMAQHRFRARVVRAETETQGDRTIYVLRMLDGTGRVFAVRVDAASGAFL